MTKEELLWNIYQSEREFIRHHEEQRTQASNIMTAIAAALVVAVGTQDLDRTAQLLVSAFIAMLGLFGAIFSAKLTALIHLHQERSHLLIDELADAVPEAGVKNLREKAKKKVEARHKLARFTSLNTYWLTLHLMIMAFGVLMIVLNLTGKV